ncbi:PPA1309 family protein [Actinotalea sp. JY-7885]|uniref:PPA1309 family protein n=1 Tax=Actinotalea sp. JY-7885 TaxID=2758576 RepID=UPI0021076301|nr:PPA1309 family protein [Actinotalea sp. JY-7885]
MSDPTDATPRDHADAAPDPAADGATAAPLTPGRAALAEAVHEIERHVAGAGWDGPVRVFALVATGRALETEPGLERQLPPEVVARARRDPNHLTSVEQEDLPAADSLEDLLARLSWPETVDGAAVVVERVMLPPEAEEAMPDDPDAALAYLMAHPDRQDVRLAVGVLRGGETWCAVRTRADDADDRVGGGPDLVPGLVHAVAATLL